MHLRRAISGGRLSIRALAQQAELSDRQFTRKFERQVGLLPKLFARTVRLNAVLDAKARAPRTTWTELAHEAGYADQAHFVQFVERSREVPRPTSSPNGHRRDDAFLQLGKRLS